MTTSLRRFQDAYASMVVAQYEPVVLRWVSFQGLNLTAGFLAPRHAIARRTPPQDVVSTTHLLSHRNTERLPRIEKGDSLPPARLLNAAGQPLLEQHTRNIEALRNAKGYKNAVAIGGEIHRFGVTTKISGQEERNPSLGNPAEGGKQIPLLTEYGLEIDDVLQDRTHDTNVLLEQLLTKAKDWARPNINASLADSLMAGIAIAHPRLPQFLGTDTVEESLSPIGIAHYYRQLYFNLEEGVGPIEQAMTVAPLESLEVVYETTQRQTFEEEIETGSEHTTESSEERSLTREVSDKTSSMMKRDISASFSAGGSYNAIVFKSNLKASASYANSRQRNDSRASATVRGFNKKAAERITNSSSVRTRQVTDVTTTNETRRIIRNDLAYPVSYGLRRVYRRVQVKVQSLGPRLVWQVYVMDPGRRLAVPNFLHYRPEEFIATGGTERPKSGSVEATITTAAFQSETELFGQDVGTWWIKIPVTPGPDREPISLLVNDLQPAKAGKYHPLAVYADSFAPEVSENGDTYTFYVRVGYHDGYTSHANVSYTWRFRPTQKAITDWEAAQAAQTEENRQSFYTEQFEREKELVAEKRALGVRPANDLRQEERYSVLSRIVGDILKGFDVASRSAPLEMELFNRYFDVDGMFTYVHPSWWVPRTHIPPYEITAESNPAPMGSSLGWRMQLDGDRHRNAFLNSPWARACLPIRPGLEREALAWLAKHVEGDIGYDANNGPVADILQEIQTFRQSEDTLGSGDGPDWIRVDSTTGAPNNPQSSEGVYPMVDEFDVTLPTEGFVYERLVVHGDEPPATNGTTDGGNGGNGGDGG